MSLLSDLNEKIKKLSTRVGTEVKSLWEGVNTAQSTATSAQTTANTAQSTADTAMAWSWQCNGSNVITSTDSDTTEFWGSAIPGVYWFAQANCLIDQPSTYGWLINLSFGTGQEVGQIWKTQAAGNLYIRGGNSSGWGNTWTPVSFNSSDRLQFRSGAQIWVA